MPGPGDRSWIAAIHVSARDYSPLGAGVVLDDRRVLTAAHLTRVDDWRPAELWVAFPLVESAAMVPRIRVDRVRPAEPEADAALADLAVLELASPIPPGVLAARLRCPPPSALEGHRWWSFGFPRGRAKGVAASGLIGTHSGYGWMHVRNQSRAVVEPGFSGGGLWCPDYDAVVGIIGEADDRGDGQALTLHQANRLLPEDEILDLSRWTIRSGDAIAKAAWSWTLAGDREADRHWRPRARGAMSTADTGNRFRGRETALREITGWLDRRIPDRTVLVVTGSPGAGKSAVLGRVVVTADSAPRDDQALRATVGSVSCAVHAKGKTALDVAREIARAASTKIPEQVEDLPVALRAVLKERQGSRFNLVIDALDEASDAHQARAIARELILPIAVDCANVGAQVLVGTRRFDGDGDLLDSLKPGATIIDLDDPKYFAVADLAAYAQATLQMRGAERPDNPYRDNEIAAAVARRIAELADRNFLIAGLVARTHGVYDRDPIQPEELQFTPRVEDALTEFLDRLPAVDGVPAVDVLTALGYIDAPGVPLSLWRTALTALTGHTVEEHGLREFTSTTAANFLIETTETAGTPVFRLFHQALNDTLTHRKSMAGGETAVTEAFIDYGHRQGWDHAPAYLLRSLPDHAARTGLIDTLLTDPDYTLYADLRRLRSAVTAASTEAGRWAGWLLRRTPAVHASPAQRLAMLSVTEALNSTDTTYRTHRAPAPYRAVWARGASLLTGRTSAMRGVCAVEVDGRDLLASASKDRTVRIWDPTTGQRLRQLTGHAGSVNGVCSVRVGDRDLLASASKDRTVRIWDPATGAQLHELVGHTDAVRGVCAVEVDGRELLASASSDRTVRIWDPATGMEIRHLVGHADTVRGVCAVRVNGRDLLASASDDGSVLIWDPVTGTALHRLTGHTGWVLGLCAVRITGQELLASASDDAVVRIWDPATGQQVRKLAGHTSWVRGVCAVRVDGRDLLAAADSGRTVRIWDPATGTELALIHTYAIPNGLTSIDPVLFVALGTGLLAVRVSLSSSAR